MSYPIKVGQQYKTPQNRVITISSISVDVWATPPTVLIRFDEGHDYSLLPFDLEFVQSWVKVRDSWPGMLYLDKSSEHDKT